MSQQYRASKEMKKQIEEIEKYIETTLSKIDENTTVEELKKVLALIDIHLVKVSFGADLIISEIEDERAAKLLEAKNNPSSIIGGVVFQSGRVMVSDPCYELGTWCQHELQDVKTGTWLIKKTVSDEGDWGIRVASLEAYIGSEPQESEYELVEEADIGVDSGQAGFFDLSGYRNTILLNSNPDPASLCHSMFMPEDPSSEDYDAELFYGVCCNLTLDGRDAGVLPGGAVSRTGYGDGSYPLLVRKDEDGLITAMKIVYLGPDEDEEEDDEADTEAMHNDEE